MTLIKFILIVAILLIIIRFLSRRNSFQTQAWKKVLLLVFAVIAVLVIISPNILNGVAHFVGVGRGADLLLYALTVAFIFEQLNSYMKSKEEHKRLVILCRKIAITEALHEEEKDG